MRLFLDANIITYIAFFEAFLVEGSAPEFHACSAQWTALQGVPLERVLRGEVEALRILYLIDDHAHFDWLCSDYGVAEIHRIRSVAKRGEHRGLLNRLLQHREEVFEEGGDQVISTAIDSRRRELFPHLHPKLEIDALQFCEAEILGADYFLTNDRSFSRIAGTCNSDLISCRPSELPFVEKHLTGEVAARCE